MEIAGAAGLARVKARWLKYTAKLQIINGCVDFLNLSTLIQNAKMDPKAVLEQDSSDEEEVEVTALLEDTYHDDEPTYTVLDHQGAILLRGTRACSESRCEISKRQLTQLTTSSYARQIPEVLLSVAIQGAHRHYRCEAARTRPY